MHNKVKGSKFEEEFADILSSMGYYVFLVGNRYGQTADIIAAKDNIIYFYEAKTCVGDTFNLSRVESNQKSASKYLRDKCNCTNYFLAIRFASGINIVPICDIDFDKKSLKFNEKWLFNGL